MKTLQQCTKYSNDLEARDIRLELLYDVQLRYYHESQVGFSGNNNIRQYFSVHDLGLSGPFIYYVTLEGGFCCNSAMNMTIILYNNDKIRLQNVPSSVFTSFRRHVKKS